jgi:hypothetical protein
MMHDRVRRLPGSRQSESDQSNHCPDGRRQAGADGEYSRGRLSELHSPISIAVLGPQGFPPDGRDGVCDALPRTPNAGTPSPEIIGQPSRSFHAQPRAVDRLEFQLGFLGGGASKASKASVISEARSRCRFKYSIKRARNSSFRARRSSAESLSNACTTSSQACSF